MNQFPKLLSEQIEGKERTYVLLQIRCRREPDARTHTPRRCAMNLNARSKRALGAFIVPLIPIPTPRVVSGEGCVATMAEIAREQGITKPLIVTDKMLVKLGLVALCTDALDRAGMPYAMFDDVTPNPPSELVEQGYEAYEAGGCDGIIAFGGGSPMDVAKVVGA